MQSFILTSKNIEARKEYIANFCKNHNISKFDITNIATESSVGIEQVRDMQKTLFLRPIKSKEKIVVIENAENLTVEAQNALLKVLEEPPNNTFIFLSCDSDEIFLPTILSRCKKITLKDNKKIENENNNKYTSIFALIQAGRVGEKLKLAEDLSKDKNEAVNWLEQNILDIRQQILDDINTQDPQLPKQPQTYLSILKQLQEAYKTLKTTNVNPRFCLENLLLSI